MKEQELERIRNWAESYCRDHGLFLVNIGWENQVITVSADSMSNITIEECAQLSRFLHAHLDVETNLLALYSLEVASPGMTNPLMIPAQYQKRLNKDLDIVTVNGEEWSGRLTRADEEGIEIEVIKQAIKKTKEPEEKISYQLKYYQIKKATIPIKFNKQ